MICRGSWQQPCFLSAFQRSSFGCLISAHPATAKATLQLTTLIRLPLIRLQRNPHLACSERRRYHTAEVEHSSVLADSPRLLVPVCKRDAYSFVGSFAIYSGHNSFPFPREDITNLPLLGYYLRSPGSGFCTRLRSNTIGKQMVDD